MATPKSERIANLEEKLKQQKARLARLKAQESQAARKRDTRQKIIIGAAVLAHAEIDPKFRQELALILNKAVTRETDLEAIAELILKLRKPSAAAPASPPAKPPAAAAAGKSPAPAPAKPATGAAGKPA